MRSDASVEVAPSPQALPYALVALSPATLQAANRATLHAASAGFSRFAAARVDSGAQIAIGDIVSMTIYEASPGGLFIPQEGGSRQGNFIQVPNQQVGASGTIDVPYAGAVRVAGLSTGQVGKTIAGRLASRAIEPQVVVSVVERRGNDVAVLGDLNPTNLPSRFSLDPGGIRLLSAIAKSGGPRFPAYETVVTVQRSGQTERAMLSRVVKDPAQNIPLRGGDSVYLSREGRVFMTLGATPSPGSIGGINNRRFAFDNDTISLSEAIAKSGGLDDNRADPTAVFIYRVESRHALEEMGIDVTPYVTRSVPTIFTVDMSRTDGVFLANAFQMRDKDVIYIANSAVTDTNKLLGFFRNSTAPFYEVSVGAAAVR